VHEAHPRCGVAVGRARPTGCGRSLCSRGSRCGDRPRLREANDQTSGLDFQFLEGAAHEDWGEAIDGGQDPRLELFVCTILTLVGILTLRGRSIRRLDIRLLLLAHASASQRRRMIVALCPPNPKALLIAVRMGTSRARFGT